MTRVLVIAFHYTLLEEPIKSEDMSVEVNPIRLIELRGVFIGVFGVEVIMGGRD